MFSRLVFDHLQLACALVAFVTSASIYFAFFWHALRMKPGQVERYANLPFETDTPASRHDP
jgi:hypothetical protein